MRRSTFLKRMAFAALACAMVELPDFMPSALRDGQRVWIRASLDVGNGPVRFYTAPGHLEAPDLVDDDAWDRDHSGLQDFKWTESEAGRSYSYGVAEHHVLTSPPDPFSLEHPTLDVRACIVLPAIEE